MSFPKVNFLPFKIALLNYFLNNLTKKTILMLASIIALDFETRVIDKNSINEHINYCINNLKRFLNKKVILDESFSTILELFTIAISNNDINIRDKNNELDHKFVQDDIINIIIGSTLTNVPSSHKIKLKFILIDLFKEFSQKQVINFIYNDNKLVGTIINNAINIHQQQHQINNYVKTEFSKILNRTHDLNKKINIFKQVSAKVVFGISALAIAGISFVIGGAALPIILIPSTIVALKYSPILGEKLGQEIINTNYEIKSEKKDLSIFKKAIYSKHENIERKINLELINNNLKKDLNITQNEFSQNVEINNIADNLKNIKSNKEIKGPSIKLKKTRIGKSRNI